MQNSFDIIVVGGGHAGCEAAHSAARMGYTRGLSVAMVTLRPDRVGFMSCNPAMGGLAKGQLIKEIDALGGAMGINTDKTAIQYRRLNSSKGPAVRSSRAQCDKALYAIEMQKHLGGLLGLTHVVDEVVDIIVKNGSVWGVKLRSGATLQCKAVIITTGTFLQAIMHTGFDTESGGRAGDVAALGLSKSLKELGFRLSRLKTGTPPRLHKESIDWAKTTPQLGDENPVPFSFYFRPERFPVLEQVACHIVYTNEKTHQIIENNFDRSPMFTGVIQGIGPRYCPSIEDKVKRFRDKDRHQLFLEPEGLTTDEIYVNGISTSLPRDVQEQFVWSIEGLEQAKFIRYGYAVEYDAVDARQLKATLESKDIRGLFTAGQINGTSGYEEAGAQGLIAGMNAVQKVLELEPIILGRHEGYIGVLIDDLILKGADEPYRMFTSRAEYRLLLREDNADLRLSKKGYEVGLLEQTHYDTFLKKQEGIEKERTRLGQTYFTPQSTANTWLESKGLSLLKDRASAEQLMRRPEITWNSLGEMGYPITDVPVDVAEQAEIQVKYEGYIKRDLELLESVQKNEGVLIPEGMDFEGLPSLSAEIRQRLKETRPQTLGQMSRMQGMTPAAVASLMIYIARPTR